MYSKWGLNVPAKSVNKFWDIKSLTICLTKRLNSRLLPHHLSTLWCTCIILIHVLLGSVVFCYSYSQQTMRVQIQKKKWPHYKQNNCVHVFYHGLFLLEFWKPCTPETEIQNSALFHCLQGGTERITHQEDLIGTFTERRVIRAVHWSLAGELGVELAGVISRLLPKEAGLLISSED